MQCCIVDDHCDVVPFIQSFWRIKKFTPEVNFCLLHFDAHPDLSFPSNGSCVNDWGDVEKVFEIITSDGGISEFIIPLIATQIINKVVWIRPSWSSQIVDGDSVLDIKERYCSITEKNIPFTSMCSPYYVDDGTAIPACELHPSNTSVLDFCSVPLVCSEINSFALGFRTNGNFADILDSSSHDPINKNWILDICLDYFSTQNPFRAEIFTSIQDDLGAISTQEQLTDIDYVLLIIKQSFEFMEHRFVGSMERSDYHSRFSSASNWREYSLGLFNSVVLTFPPQKTSESNTTDFLGLYSQTNVQYGMELLAILPFLSMKSRHLIVNAGSLLLLPHHCSSEDEIRSMLVDFESFLNRIMAAPHIIPPCFITIAKSTDDGYTPPHQATFIYNSVIEIIMRVFGLNEQVAVVVGEDSPEYPPSSYSGGTLYIHDLCEDAISMAHSSLLRANIMIADKASKSGANSSGRLSNKRKIALLREHGLDV